MPRKLRVECPGASYHVMSRFRRGWCLGSEAFRQAMLEEMGGKLGDNHSGELRSESAQTRAERIIEEELCRLGWEERELISRRKSDPAKLAIAARLRKKTTLKGIAVRLHLGTSKSANIRLNQWNRDQVRGQQSQRPSP